MVGQLPLELNHTGAIPLRPALEVLLHTPMIYMYIVVVMEGVGGEEW